MLVLSFSFCTYPWLSFSSLLNRHPSTTDRTSPRGDQGSLALLGNPAVKKFKDRMSSLGLVRITSWHPNFNGSHFGLSPSEIHRMTQNDWTATQNRGNYDVIAQAPLELQSNMQIWMFLQLRASRENICTSLDRFIHFIQLKLVDQKMMRMRTTGT